MNGNLGLPKGRGLGIRQRTVNPRHHEGSPLHLAVVAIQACLNDLLDPSQWQQSQKC